jgi:hypothetical protein
MAQRRQSGHVAAFAGGALVLMVAGAGLAHVNDRGMDYTRYRSYYGQSCCDDTDCRPAADFEEGRDQNGHAVVRLLVDGHWISLPSFMVVAEDAVDGRAHWCGLKVSVGSKGDWRPSTRCVILPPRNM